MISYGARLRTPGNTGMTRGFAAGLSSTGAPRTPYGQSIAAGPAVSAAKSPFPPSALAPHDHPFAHLLIPLIVSCLAAIPSDSPAAAAGFPAPWYPPRAEASRVGSATSAVSSVPLIEIPGETLLPASRWDRWVDSIAVCPSLTPEFWVNILAEMERSRSVSPHGFMRLQPSDLGQFISVWRAFDDIAVAEFIAVAGATGGAAAAALAAAEDEDAGRGEDEAPTPRRAFDFSSPAPAPAPAPARAAPGSARPFSAANRADGDASSDSTTSAAAIAAAGGMFAHTPSATRARGVGQSGSLGAVALPPSTALATTGASKSGGYHVVDAAAAAAAAAAAVAASGVGAGAVAGGDSHRVTVWGFAREDASPVRSALSSFGEITDWLQTPAMANWAVATFASPAAAAAAIARSGRLRVSTGVVGVQPFRQAHVLAASSAGSGLGAPIGAPGTAVVVAGRLVGGDEDQEGVDMPAAGVFSVGYGTGTASGARARGAAGAAGTGAGAGVGGAPAAGPTGYQYDDQVKVASRVIDVDVFADATTQRRLKGMSVCQKVMRFVMNC